jgi:chaperone BCS1
VSISAALENMAGVNGSTDIQPIFILNTLFPGFSILASAIYEHLKIDATAYVPAILLVTLVVLASQYGGEYLWCQIEAYFMSTADIRVDDELYNMLMAVSEVYLTSYLQLLNRILLE